MKIFLRKNEFERGFSLVEIMISIALLAGVSYIGLKQSDIISNSSINISLDRQIDELASSIETFVTKKSVCENNFIYQVPKTDYTSIKDEFNSDIYVKDTVYLDGKVKIKNISTIIQEGDPVLEIMFEKLKSKSSSKTISKRIRLSADLSPAKDAIISCFSLSNSIDETVKKLVAKKICEDTYGVGTTKFIQMYSDIDGTCSFDGLEQGANCGAESGILKVATSFGYDSTNMVLKSNCKQIVTQKSCANGWYKNISLDGQFECASITDYINVDDDTQFNEGSTCKLQVYMDTTKNHEMVRFLCEDAALVPTATASASATICSQGSSGDLNQSECTNSDLVPCGTVITDSCGNTCVNDPLGKKECPVVADTCTAVNWPFRSSTILVPEKAAGESFNSAGGATCGSGISCFCGVPQVSSLMGGSSTGSVEWSCQELQSCSGTTTGSSGGCFIAGTQVAMFDGTSKSIEDVTLKDRLMGTNNRPVNINKLMSFEHNDYKYSFNGSDYFVTGGHPFKTFDGWKSFDLAQGKKDNPTLKIKQMKIGDAILTQNSFEIIRYFSKRKNKSKVYNFHVDGRNEYIANGYQVHNKCDGGWTQTDSGGGYQSYNCGDDSPVATPPNTNGMGF